MSRLVQINRDPFARSTLMREVINTRIFTCRWCGSNHHGRLFAYVVQSDDGRKWPLRGLFCSVGCMRIYHDLG